MSLHRVSSMESWEQPVEARGNVDSDTQHQKMSFNPIPEQTAPAIPDMKPSIPTETSQAKRICMWPSRTFSMDQLTPWTAVQICLACIFCLFSSGIVFGYAAFKQVLVREGVYEEYCTHAIPEDRDQTCYEQELRQAAKALYRRIVLTSHLGSISCSPSQP